MLGKTLNCEEAVDMVLYQYLAIKISIDEIRIMNIKLKQIWWLAVILLSTLF